MSMSMSSSSSPPSKDGSAFTKLEHENWQKGVDAYAKGFGPLTSRVAPILLDRAGFLASSDDESSNSSNRDLRLLDVACGPGQVIDSAISRAESKPPPQQHPPTDPSCCTYTGLDFSSNFLALARKNLETKHPRVAVTLLEGDAQNMVGCCNENQFDSVTSNFGILHLKDPDSFLAESYRVLKPGGSLAFSVWAAPPATEGFDLILSTVHDVGNPNVDLPDGPPFFRFSDAIEVRRSLEAAGFVDVQTTLFHGGDNDNDNDNDNNKDNSDSDSDSVLPKMEWDSVDSSQEMYKVLLEGTARTRELLLGQSGKETSAILETLNQRYESRVSVNLEEGGKDETEGVATTTGERRKRRRRRFLRMPAVVSSGRKPLPQTLQ